VAWPDRKDAKDGIPASSARDILVAGRFALRSRPSALRHWAWLP